MSRKIVYIAALFFLMMITGVFWGALGVVSFFLLITVLEKNLTKASY